MKSTNKFNVYIWIALGLVYFFLRYQNIPGVFSEMGLVVPDTDPYYRLHRIISIVQGSWIYPLFETKLNFPFGWDVAWPLGLDLLIATPLKLLGVQDPFYIKAFAFFIIPIVSIPIIVLAGLVAFELSLSIWMTVLSVFFLILMRTLLFQTNVGRLDHHFLEALFPLLFFWLWLKMKKRRVPKYLDFWFALSLGLSLSFYPHAWIIFVMLMFPVGFSDVKAIEKMMKVFFYAFWISLIPLAMSDRFWNFNINFSAFSWWGSLVLLVCSLVTSVMFHIRKRKKLNRAEQVMLILGLVGLVGLIITNGLSNFIYQVRWAFSWLHANQGTLEGTKESWSVFRFSFSQMHDIYLIFLMPLVFAWFYKKKKYQDVLLYSWIPILFTFLQIRFMAMASPWIAILIVFYFADFIMSTGRDSVSTKYITCFGILLLSLPYFPKLGFTHNKTHDYLFYPVRAASLFLKDQVDQKSLPVEKTGVLGTWDYGHWILFYSGLPVVAHPFQGSSSARVQALYGSENDVDLENFHSEVPFRYMLVENSNRKFQDALIFSGKNPDAYLMADELSRMTGIQPFKKHFLYERMLDRLGANDQDDFSDHLRLVYVSHLSSPDNANQTAMKVFEYVPGMQLQYASREKDLYLQTKVYEKQWDRMNLLRKKSQLIGYNRHSWIVPYGKYDQGGVASDGVYEVVNQQGRVLHRFHVTEDQILYDHPKI